MSNVFGRNRSSSGGESRYSSLFAAATDDATETAEEPKKEPSNLNLNSVVRSSFDQALTDAKTVMAPAPKPKDTGFNPVSVTTSFVGGTFTGLTDIVTSPFKKSRDQLEKEAKYGGVASTTTGDSFMHGVIKTGGDVVKAGTTLNPLSEQGRSNIGLAWNKYQTSLTTGSWEDRANVAGQTFAFIGSFAIGGSQAAKIGRVNNELKVLRVAAEAGTATERVVTKLDDVERVVARAGTVGTRVEGLTPSIAEHANNAARIERAVLPHVAQASPSFTTRFLDASRNAGQKAKVLVADSFGLGGATVATENTSTFSRFTRRMTTLFKTEGEVASAGGKRFFTVVDDTARVADGGGAAALQNVRNMTQVTVREIGDSAGKLIAKGGHDPAHVRVLENIKNLADEVAQGKTPLSRLTEAMKELPSGTRAFEGLTTKAKHLDEFGAQSARILGREVTQGHLDDLGQVITRLESTATHGPQTQALAEVRAAAKALADGTGDANRLARTIKEAGDKGINVNELVTKADDLTRAASRSNLMTRVEQGMGVARQTVDEIGTSLDEVARTLPRNSDGVKQIQEVKRLAAEVANGAPKSEELMVAIRNLEASNIPGVTAKMVDDLAGKATRLERVVGEARLAGSIENAIASVKSSVDELGKTKLVNKAGQEFAADAPELAAFKKVQQAADDLARGTGSPQKVREALDELKKFDTVNPEVVNQISQKTANVVDNVASTRLVQHLDEALQPVRKSLNEIDNAIATVRATDPAEAARIERVVRDFVAGRTTNLDDVKSAFSKVNQDGRFTLHIDDLGRTVSEARPAIKLEQSLTSMRHIADDVANVTDDIARRYAPGTTQHKAVQEVKAAFDGAAKGTVTAEELTETVARHARVLDNVRPGSAEVLTQNARKLADSVSDTTRLVGIKNGTDDIVRVADDIIKDLRKAGGQEGKIAVLEDLQSTARGVANGTKSADDLKVALEKAKEAGVNPETLSRIDSALVSKVDDLAKHVSGTERLAAIEKGLESTKSLSSTVQRYADDMERVVRQSSNEFKAVDEVREAASRAARSGNKDELIAAIRKNEDVLESIKPGSTKQLIEQVTKGGDDLASAGGKQALRNVTTHLDEIETVVKSTSKEFKAVDEIRTALRGARETGFGDDLVNAVERNKPVLQALETKAPAVLQAGRTPVVFDDLARTVKSLSDETAQARKLTAVENSVKSTATTVDNLIAHVDDAGRTIGSRSVQSGKDLAADVRTLANTTDDVATKNRLLRVADDLEGRAGTFNNVEERLKVVRSVADDVASGKIKDTHFADFVKKTNLDDIVPGAARRMEAHIDEVADAGKLSRFHNTRPVETIVKDLGDEVARVPNATGDLSHRVAVIKSTAREVDELTARFARGEAKADEVSEAADRLAALARADKSVMLPQLEKVEQKAVELANAMRARTDVFESQYVRLAQSLERGGPTGYKGALDAINHMHAVSTPEVREALVNLREAILDQRALRTMADQGYTMVLPHAGTAINTRPVIGIVTDRGQLHEAIERIARRSSELESGKLSGLTRDPISLLRDPALKTEQARRQLVKDLLAAAGGAGLMTWTGYALYNKAHDTVVDIRLAPYRIANLMELEAAAQSEDERQYYKARLAKALVEQTENKSDEEIEELRAQVAAIIEARAKQDTTSQAVWSRRLDEAAVSPMLLDAANRAQSREVREMREPTLDEVKEERRHRNQTQYGNPMGWLRGPGGPVVADVVQVIPNQQPVARVRINPGNQDNVGDKGKTATPGFDIAKVRELTNIYNPSALRAMPFGSPLGPQVAAMPYGSAKSWQSQSQPQVAGRRHGFSSENGARGIYGQFANIEDTQDEKDKPGTGPGSAQNDPDPSQIVLTAQVSGPSTMSGNNDEDNQGVTTTV